MTLERFALRVAASLAVGWILAVFGAVMVGTGLAIGTAVPSQR